MTSDFHPTRLGLLAAVLAFAQGTASAADAPAAKAEPAPAAAPAAVRPQPAETAPTRQALQTLLGALPPRPQGQAEGPPRVRVTAKRGETLDAVIRRTMGDSPFKESFLRGAYLEINAGAVQPGTTRLIAGAQVQVPNLEDLRNHLQRVLGPQQASHAADPAPSDKRHWIRYP